MRTDTGKPVRLKDYQRPAYSIDKVDLDVRLDPAETRIVSRVLYRRDEGTSTGTALELDGDELQFVSAKLNGDALGDNSYQVSSDGFTLVAPPDSDTFELEITTICAPSSNTKLMGLFQSNGVYCTQCEADGFRRISYFLDRPDVLATYTTRIEADKKDVPHLLGNGNRVETGDLDGGRHYAIWHDPHPKPSYLFALVGGDLGFIKDTFTTMSGRVVDLAIYVEKGKEDRALYAMDALKRSMKWDEEVFGCEYDLDVFNIVAVSDFNMGAMENKGLNIFNDKFVLANPETATDADYANIERIIAHEYFHNWTGNRITCRDWFQLCLKEGLTVYRDQEFSADQNSRAVARIGDVRKLQALQFPEDGGPLAHPVRPERYKEINNLYTTTIYEKGAELVRMIATIVGPEGFRKGTDLYLARHDGEAARVEDFLASFEDACNVDFGQFALWYSQAGTPQLTVSIDYDRSGKSCRLEIEQSLAATPGQSRKKLMHIPVRYGLIGKDGADIDATKVTGGRVEGDVIHLTRRTTKLAFHGIEERPVVSLLRGFSAPVNIDINQSKADQLFLARHDSDLFNRWQSVQNLLMQELVAATKSTQKGKPLKFDARIIDILIELSHDKNLEPAFRAQALYLPTEIEIARKIGKNIDPDAIYSARRACLQTLGMAFGDDLISLAASFITPGSYAPTAEDSGKRALKNLLLSFAVMLGDDDAIAMAKQQFGKAKNMADQISALVMLVQHTDDAELQESSLATFYDQYKDDPLVVDKWLAIQAGMPGESALERVRGLTGHKAFSLTNPNRTRALVGSFVSGNQTGFNRKDGAAYQFFADIVLELDPVNPQVAARLMTGLRSWKSLEKTRMQKAKAVLERIAAEKLSNDVRDIVDRILDQD